MIEPIMAQLQQKLYQSVMDNMQGLLTGVFPGKGFAADSKSLQARVSEFDNLIAAAAQRYDLDPALLKAVAHAESNLAPASVSHTGAKGLMQLMDSTAQQLGVIDSFDPAQNIDGGARFLRQLLDHYDGNVVLALAAYNAGPGAVDRWGGLPPYSETQAYIPRVLGLRDQYREWTA
jgi:soluble lytic murein transglycosylase-like protein